MANEILKHKKLRAKIPKSFFIYLILSILDIFDSELFNKFKPTPQILENIIFKDKSVINSKECKSAIKKANKIIKNNGRMLVRKSGTEPKIRIMGESHDKKLLLKCVKIVKKSIE